MALFIHDGKTIPSAPTYKDPDSLVDYRADWSGWLGTDTISTSVWLIDGVQSASVNGLDITSTSDTSTAATVWLDNGTLDSVYTITSRITTAGGRVTDASFLLTIKEK